MEEVRTEESVLELFIQLSHKYFAKCFQQLSGEGVHPGQMPILHTLSCHEGISQAELAKMIHVKPPTVTVAVKRLEKGGFVCRKADEEDQRVSRIYLTPEGEAVTDRLREIAAGNEKILTRGFSESEICLMRRLFHQMIENIEIMQ